MAGHICVCVNRMVVGGGRGGTDPNRRGGGGRRRRRRRLGGETFAILSLKQAQLPVRCAQQGGSFGSGGAKGCARETL